LSLVLYSSNTLTSVFHQYQADIRYSSLAGDLSRASPRFQHFMPSPLLGYYHSTAASGYGEAHSIGNTSPLIFPGHCHAEPNRRPSASILPGIVKRIPAMNTWSSLRRASRSEASSREGKGSLFRKHNRSPVREHRAINEESWHALRSRSI